MWVAAQNNIYRLQHKYRYKYKQRFHSRIKVGTTLEEITATTIMDIEVYH
jgi:hypothetical protein